MKFNSIIFQRDTLQSNIIRNLLGERVVDLTEEYFPVSTGEGSFLSQIFNLGKRFIGFTIGLIIKGIRWTFADLWDVVVEAYFEVKYFDWNQTDDNLKNELARNDEMISGALGRLTGTSLAWLTGIAVSTGLSFKYPVLSGKVALALAEEGGQEIRSAITNLIIVSRQAAVRSMLLGGLLNARKLEIFGFKPVTTQRKPWTLNDAIETTIKKLPSGSLQAFATQAFDAFEDAVIEMGYVVAYTLDDFYLSQRRASQSVLGQERTIELTPDVRVPDERIILESPQELAITATQSAIVSHQLIHNRDVGQIAGMPERDYVSPMPQRRKLKVIFRGKETPPWTTPDGKISKTVEVNIPDIKYGLTWQELKNTVKSYTWGKYQVTAHLSNGRQMRVFAVSYKEGEEQCYEYIKLSTAEILRFHHGVAATDHPDPKQRKIPTRVYPAYATLTAGDVKANGQLNSKKKAKTRVDLWVDEEPDNADDLR